MTATPIISPDDVVLGQTPVVSGKALARMRRQKARANQASGVDRGIVSATEWRRPRIRFPLATAQLILLILLIIAGLMPVLWLMKAAFTPTQEDRKSVV